MQHCSYISGTGGGLEPDYHCGATFAAKRSGRYAAFQLLVASHHFTAGDSCRLGNGTWGEEIYVEGAKALTIEAVDGTYPVLTGTVDIVGASPRPVQCS